jgi:hypothetical protein
MKTKIALIAALVAGTASIASAQEFDSNLANRYPTYNGPVAANSQALRAAPVRLGHQGQVWNGQPETVYPQSPAGGGY